MPLSRRLVLVGSLVTCTTATAWSRRTPARTVVSRAEGRFLPDFDLLFGTLSDKYCFFGEKKTDWAAVGRHYRSLAAAAATTDEFMRLIEPLLDELYDPHTHLGSNRRDSWRLPPFDVWAEWQGRHAVVREVKDGAAAHRVVPAFGRAIGSSQ